MPRAAHHRILTHLIAYPWVIAGIDLLGVAADIAHGTAPIALHAGVATVATAAATLTGVVLILTGNRFPILSPASGRSLRAHRIQARERARARMGTAYLMADEVRALAPPSLRRQPRAAAVAATAAPPPTVHPLAGGEAGSAPAQRPSSPTPLGRGHWAGSRHVAQAAVKHRLSNLDVSGRPVRVGFLPALPQPNTASWDGAEPS